MKNEHNMADHDQPDALWLLDDHLGQLSEEQKRILQDRLQSDPKLATENSRLQRILLPLDSWTAAVPPTGLVDRILGEIAAQKNQHVMYERDLPSGETRGRVGRLFLHDFVAVAACLALFFGLLAPSMSAVRERSRQAVCAANLGGIGRAVSAYSLANNNALPCAPVTGRTSFLASGQNQTLNIVYQSNRQHPLLLARYHFVGSVRVFICPSQKTVTKPMDTGTPVEQRCSYDSINMAGPTPKYSIASSLPYMGDANPLFAGGKLNRIDPTVTNSPNHGRRGQNILSLDGSTRWTTTPNQGRHGDNIWQSGQKTKYTGTEVQQSQTDTFLVP